MGIKDDEFLAKINKLRYQFEHVMLPTWFYLDKDKFTQALIDKTAIIDEIFFRMCNNENIFDIWIKGYKSIYTQDGDLNAIIVTCPNCISTPQCNKIFMLWNNEKRFYFALEFDDIMGKLTGVEPYFILCGWDENKKHCNFGEFNEDNEKLIERIKELFKDV